VRFWDSSALVSLTIREKTSQKLFELLENDGVMAVASITYVECWSAVIRARNGNRIPSDIGPVVRSRLDRLRANWFEMGADDEIRLQAVRLIDSYGLRAGDAIQLGSAIIWRGRYDHAELVALDGPLRDAARSEDFFVL